MNNDIKSILIEKHKAVFTVLSKNACTSMKAHIVKSLNFSQSIIFPEDVHGPRVYDYPTLTNEELISTYSSYLRFCIVRNPWSRLVSCYKNKIRGLEINNHIYKNGVNIDFAKRSKDFREDMTFTEFVDVVCGIPDNKSDRHFRSQIYDIVMPNGELRVNYLVKLENLQTDLEDIQRFTGMKFDDFPSLNNSLKKKTYLDYYTPETIEKVNNRYLGDIELFNYSFNEKETISIGRITEKQKQTFESSSYYQEIIKEIRKGIEVNDKKVNPVKSDKVFCIGLNKTGTRSVSTALNILKIRTAHFNSPRGRIGEIFKFNVQNNNRILAGLEYFSGFSDWIDMEGSNNEFYKIMDAQYPGSKFIYTDRGLESWIESRLKHVKKTDRLSSYQKAYSNSIWYNMNVVAWSEEYRKHKQDVLDYFKGREEDLLMFNVFEGDGWKSLCSFLGRKIPNRPFPVKGKSEHTRKTFIQLYSRKGNISILNQSAIFFLLPGGANLPIKASLISYLDQKIKFEFPKNKDLVNDYDFPVYQKDMYNSTFENLFRFTIVRNPWDRLAACYSEMICNHELPERYFEVGVDESFNEFDDLFYRDMPFDEFIRKVCSIAPSRANRHISSQIYQLTSSKGSLLVNYIGYYERLREAALDIYEQTQISLHEVPPSFGEINDTSYTELYTKELRQEVQVKFAADIALFGYEFGIPFKLKNVDFVSNEFVAHFESTNEYVDTLKEKNISIHQELAKTLKEKNHFKEELCRKEYEFLAFKGEDGVSRYQRNFEDMQNSLSWKITAPLRRAGGFLSSFLSKK